MAKTNANLIWKIADLLRGPYQPNQYGDVILPFTILRRLDCILEPTKEQVIAEYTKAQSQKIDPAVVLKSKFKLPFFNTSRWTFASLVSDPEGVADNLIDYIARFSPNVRDVFEGFRLPDLIADLDKSRRLYLIVKEFAAVDLHPDVVSGTDMGYIFEELIRKFAESNNAADCTVVCVHHTPRTGSAGRGSNAWDGAIWSDLRVEGGGLRASATATSTRTSRPGCDHHFSFRPHTVSKQLMPRTLLATERETLVMSRTLSDLGKRRTSARQAVLDLIWTMAPREGFAAPELLAMLESAEISRTSTYEALKWGVGQGYLDVGGTERKSRWVPGKVRPPWLPSDD